MKLYLGSRDVKADGFLTVDIDPQHSPDILADVTDLSAIESGTVEEICASHVLEHIAWPVAYKALAEWARVLRTGGLLRIAVPDLAVLGAMMAEGQNIWAAVAVIFGVFRLENRWEGHQYGYTRGMLISILRSLGFSRFDWWKHDVHDASNGYILGDSGKPVAISLNLAAEKTSEPIVPPDQLFERLLADRERPFDAVFAEVAEGLPEALLPSAERDPMLTQRLHKALTDAKKRIMDLERALSEERARAIETSR